MSVSPNLLARTKAWQAAPDKELKRLGCDNKTSDWMLPGACGILEKRTRGISKKKEAIGEDEDDLDVSHSDTENILSPVDLNLTSITAAAKAPAGDAAGAGADDPTRVLLEASCLRKLLGRVAKCSKCGSSVNMEIKSCGINTHIKMTCANAPRCNWTDSTGKGALTDFPLPEGSGSPLIERTTDYASNVLYVLSNLSVGDGGREAERHLTFLGLPNATTMEKSTFSPIEERISPRIQKLNREILKENLMMEVEAVMCSHLQADFDQGAFDIWKNYIATGNMDDMENAILPAIVVAADMGWQKRSSGRRYDSNSGHAILVAKLTRLPVALSIKSKLCKKCDSGSDHSICYRNHEGSSGSMEPQAILDMIVGLYDDHKVVCRQVISDDDSSIKAKLRYSNEDHLAKYGEQPTVINSKGEVKRRPNKGALPIRLQQPTFLADPNHRKKTLKNALYALLSKRVGDRHTMTKADVIRLGKNFAFMARTLQYVQPNEYLELGKAVLEHHFDNHEFCGGWCRRKLQSDEDKAKSNKFYRSKIKDKVLYGVLFDIVSRFVTHDALVEVAHGSDTQVNESFNNTASWLAPKNKTYCGSCSLTNRLCVGIGILSLGTFEYYSRLFDNLGIKMPLDVARSLQMKGNARATKLERSKENDFKTNRMKKEYAKLELNNQEAKQDRATRDGVAYKTGVGMAGGYADSELEAGGEKKRKRGAKSCSTCGGTDHSRVTSKKCANHEEYLSSRNKVLPNKQCAARQELLERDASQQDDFDSIPFTNDVKDEDHMDVQVASDASNDISVIL